MRPGIVFLVAMALLATTSPGQWLITEVFTGAPDFVEITNVSGIALPVAGVGIVVANNSVCVSTAPTVGGAYIATSPAVIPAGGTFLFEDLGVAGGLVLTVGLTPPGEHTGFNFSWASASILEVAIYDMGVIPGGVPGLPPNHFDDVGVLMDYVQVQNLIPALPVTPIIAADDFHLHRGTPLTPIGHWTSGPVLRSAVAPVTDDIFRVSVGGVYVDTSSNADWNLAALPSGGLANPPGIAGVATAGCELNIFHLAPGVPILSFNVATYNPPVPAATYYTFITFSPETCAGYSPGPFIPGPIIGMPGDVFSQIFIPVPLPPLNGFLDAAGAAIGIITPPIPPPFAGLLIQARTVVLVGGIPSLFSNYVYTII